MITIFLNAERFLSEAIESVLAQTYRDWELILVNDGSTDGSKEIARSYVTRYPGRIRYAEHANGENRGMSASRNLGIRLARGEFIALLDADDVYLPEKLEHQVTVLEAHPEAGVVYGVTEYWYSWTNEARDTGRDWVRARGVQAGAVIPPGALIGPLVGDLVRTPCTCGVLMQRDVVNRIGGFEDRFRGMFEDQVFFFKLFLATATVVDGRTLDRYRQHENSTCRQALANGEWARGSGITESRRAFLEWLEVFLADERIRDRGLHHKIRRELLPYRHPALAPLWSLLSPLRAIRERLNRRIRYARSV